MHITFARQLNRRSSPTSNLKVILWTHPLMHVRRSMLTRQFRRGICWPRLSSVIRRSYRRRPPCRPSRPSHRHIIPRWWRRHNMTLAVVLPSFVNKNSTSRQGKNKRHTAPNGNSRYCSSAESRRWLFRVRWRRRLFGACLSCTRRSPCPGVRSPFHLHGQVWSVKSADWRCLSCATSGTSPHSRPDVNGHNVGCQLRLVQRPDCIFLVLLAQVHVVCALDNGHIADLVCGVGVCPTDDKHLCVVNYVAAHHALGERSGAVTVGWVWTSDPLEARNAKDIDIIVARCVWREASAAVDVTDRLSSRMLGLCE
jgi:hypothetical protein